ncbi:hypothetical protein [Amycolatopsis sp. FDAARGOS 1241]|uniref:hypothetical protein n=1 Tax=Amycolatopsis sp. FDAARGOS 1241 TaxID=2778070 RepID=UPI001EF30F1F|nr:hypothetical protein [Amycolatopsis sp. FDAARGOS 1241]
MDSGAEAASSPDRPRPAARGRIAGRRRAAGIYGAIVTAAILTAAGGRIPTGALALAVVVTLIVYWAAEEYAELLGQQVERGKLPTARHVRTELAVTWPMVSASYGPLLALLAAWLAGASDTVAANTGLVVAVVLLVYHAWSAGRAAQLRGRQLIVTTFSAAALGILMIVLKNFVLLNLH